MSNDRKKSKENEGNLQKTGAKGKRRIFTRRRVLSAAGAVVASGALATGGFLIYDHRQRFGRTAGRSISDHRIALPALFPKMVVARGEDPERNVVAAIDRLGGIEQFVNSDDVVVIKPNIGWDRTPEQGANTHPEVVAAVVKACREVSPRRLIVCDCPVAKSRRAFRRSGIYDAAVAAGAEVIAPEDSQYHTVEISPRLGTWEVLEPFVLATKVINVPVAKHHNLTGTTAGMKNWIGITGKLRLMFHNDLQNSIAELAALMRPTLTVLDASRVLMHHGPQGGNLDDVKPLKTVVASVDPVAVDAWACSQFGAPQDSWPEYLDIAQKLGLGRKDFSSLQPLEIVV